MKSIFIDDSDIPYCMYCGTTKGPFHEHHIFPGSFRKVSEKFGLKIRLCWLCHRKIHDIPELMDEIKKKYQKKAMEFYNWNTDDWISNIGKNFL